MLLFNFYRNIRKEFYGDVILADGIVKFYKNWIGYVGLAFSSKYQVVGTETQVKEAI